MSFTLRSKTFDTPNQDTRPVAASTGFQRRSVDGMNEYANTNSNDVAPVFQNSQRVTSDNVQNVAQSQRRTQQVQNVQSAPQGVTQNFMPHWRATFSGEDKEDLSAYIAQFEYYVRYNGLSDHQAASMFVASLRGKAQALCVQIDPTSGYKDIVAIVKQRFMPLATSMWLACDIL